jgi:hypothetical protein|tara:strand:+ start:6200 stop:6397 length:198 start_codon:yes stop_codon:yes gene_type:complete
MNSVFSLLIGNPGIKLSVKSMSKRLGIKKKEVFYLCFKDPRIRRVSGIEVGTNKRNLSVFTIDPQ